jgi:hypothetical protein
MKTAAVIGSFIVMFALLFYSVGFLKVRKVKIVNTFVLVFYTIGVSLDITATTFMIIGSTKGLFTTHGLLGYSALLGMLTDTVLLWRYNLKFGASESISKPLHLYSRIAYAWWIIAFISGGLLVLFSKMPT